jgi:hypothetical protein
MKYLLETKASNNPEHQILIEILEDVNGDYIDEVCINFDGLRDFERIESYLILNKRDLNSLIGLLLQAQQTIRNKRNG